jgi:hypothetical protein
MWHMEKSTKLLYIGASFATPIRVNIWLIRVHCDLLLYFLYAFSLLPFPLSSISLTLSHSPLPLLISSRVFRYSYPNEEEAANKQ